MCSLSERLAGPESGLASFLGWVGGAADWVAGPAGRAGEGGSDPAGRSDRPEAASGVAWLADTGGVCRPGGCVG